MRAIPSLLLMLLTSACAGIGPGACGLEGTTPLTMAMTAEGGPPYVSVAINGHPIRLVLDTGADRTVLGARAAAMAGVRPLAGPAGAMGAIGGGSGQVRQGVVDRLELGTLRIESLPVAVIGDFEVDGVLGLDVLSRYEVELDLAKGVAVLHQGTLCPGALPPMAGDVLELPAVRGVLRADGATREADPYLMVPVSLDGVKALAMLDSGAMSGSIASTEFAGLAGVGQGALAADPALVVRGFGTSTTVHRHRFGELLVGREVFRAPELQVGGGLNPRIPVVIGADYFRTHHVWLDFPGRRVFVVPTLYPG